MLRSLPLLLGALILLGALAANAYVALRSVTTLQQGFENEIRPAEVQRTLLGLLSAIQDAETGQRGYLITGKDPYLDPYVRANAEADSLLDVLDSLVSWNSLQVERMPGLRAAVDAKFSELSQSLTIYSERSPAAAIALVETDRGRRSMQDIRERIDEMYAEARRVRTMFAARADLALRDARRSAWIATMALALLLAILVWMALAATRRRERHAERLASANGALEDANRAQSDAMASLSTALGEREAALARVSAMQAQLVQQEKLAGMGRLTAGVAHEIKNPLNFVTNFAALTTELADEATQSVVHGDMQETTSLLQAISENAAKILLHGRRADDIVQSMLVHARGVTGTRRPEDLADVIDAAVLQAVGPDAADDVTVTVDVDPTLGPIEMVPEAVTRALRNLVDNALFAVRLREGAGDPTYRPAVRITAAQEKSPDGHVSAEVTVTDNGPGIPDDLFPRIFEPFFTTKSPGSGTGMGLSLAHDIAVGHGGSLLAERPPGGGAAFVLALPAASLHGEAQEPGVAPAEPPAG